MGNSNSSIGQFTPNDIDLRHRAHWQYLSQQQQQQNQRGSSFPSNDPNTINTSIKVLPELNDTSGHLRSTDNGMILFNGGTISGRRDASAVGVVRSKSISSPQHEYMRGLQRHKTQLDMPVQRTAHVNGGVGSGGSGLRRDVDPKLFGSEPDLRLSPADGGPQNGRNSRKFKGQPAPKSLATSAQQQQQLQQQREYDSTRFGWRPKSSPSHHNHQQGHGKLHPQQGNHQSNHHQDRLPINEQAKKPRLFKTREETKKVSSKANQSKLATEASDVQSKKPIPGRQVNGKRETERIRDDSTTDRVIKVIGNRAPVPEKLLPKAEVLSKPVFRREKSFDISLLLSRGAQKGTSLFPNVFRKSSTTDKSPPVIQHGKVIPPPPAPEDKGGKSRRASQPPPRLDKDNFQKELLEATRRRSMQVPAKKEDNINAVSKSPAVQKSTIVTQSPVLKAMSKPRPPKENSVRPQPLKSKAPKPPQSPKVEAVLPANKIQLEIRNGPTTNATPATNPVTDQQQREKEQHSQSDDAFPGGEVSEKPVKSFYYGMPEQERTGTTTTTTMAMATASKVNGFLQENEQQKNGQVDADASAGERRSQTVEDDVEHDRVELTAIESFAESIFAMKNRQQQLQPQRDSSESAVSSFAEDALSPVLYASNNSHNIDNARLAYEDAESLEGISLQLRPTLPKKQFEIPRFSPAAAWRLLTTSGETGGAREVMASQLKFDNDHHHHLDYNNHSDELEEDVKSLGSGNESNERGPDNESRGGEEQIERIYREPVPGLADNKSGDSGISGDGGLLELGDSSPTNNLLVNDLRKLGPFLQPWTPQQDLEDDSSSDPDPVEDVDRDEQQQLNNLHHRNNNNGQGGSNTLGRLKDLRTIEDVVAQKHVFSLSLPRDSQNLSDKGATTNSDKHFFSSLQKTKLGHCYSEGPMSGRGQQPVTGQTTTGNDNWFLGRSQPNSIDKNHLMPSLSDNEEAVSLPKICAGQQQPAIQPPSFNYLAGGCHFMYLPNRPTTMSHASSSSVHNPYPHPTNSHHGSASLLLTPSVTEKVNNGPPPLPPSAPPAMRDSFRENLQDNNNNNNHDDDAQETVWNVPLRVGGRKGRRFTFQSTVRQIERRKIADKLSREAEEREAQRLSELEAMQKVEQEFQMKRAREKASIRQQLRLFSMEEKQYQNQSYQCDADYSPSSIRREPDGAAESMGNSKLLNGCHPLSSTSLLLELNGYHNQQQQQTQQPSGQDSQYQFQSMTVVTSTNNNLLSRDYSKFPYREFLK